MNRQTGTGKYEALLERCRNLELPATEPVEAGIDVGGGGDRTHIRERRGRRAGRSDTFIDADPMRTVGKLVESINDWGIQVVKVDSTRAEPDFYRRVYETAVEAGAPEPVG